MDPSTVATFAVLYFVAGMFTLAFTAESKESGGTIFVRVACWPLLWAYGLLVGLIAVGKAFPRVFTGHRGEDKDG